MSPTTDSTLGYHAMRLLWCRLALLAFLRRWGIYVLTATAVLAAGADGFVQIVSAASAWLVLPLFYAAGHGAWLLPALLLQAALGTGCVWGMRSALWPARWAEAERALPIAPRQTQLSDLCVVLIALLPLGVLYLAGAANLLGHDPDWLRPTRGRAGAALLLAFAASVASGVALLQRLRLPVRAGLRHRPPTTMDDAARPLPISGALSLSDALRRPLAAASAWPSALLWLPLWRGPARRTGNALLLGSTLALLPAPALLRWPQAAPWWLAGFALLALLAVTRVDTLAREEITPLLDACCALPLPPRRLTRARAALGMLPMLPGLALLCAVCVGLPLAGLRPWVLAAYAVACLMSGAFEVLSAPAAAADKAGRWLFTLVLCVCLATEVVF